MRYRINYFAEPSGPKTAPYPITWPIGEFDSIEHARELAFKEADNPTIQAHSFIIERADDFVDLERWVRDENGWKRDDARGPK